MEKCRTLHFFGKSMNLFLKWKCCRSSSPISRRMPFRLVDARAASRDLEHGGKEERQWDVTPEESQMLHIFAFAIASCGRECLSSLPTPIRRRGNRLASKHAVRTGQDRCSCDSSCAISKFFSFETLSSKHTLRNSTDWLGMPLDDSLPLSWMAL